MQKNLEDEEASVYCNTLRAIIQPFTTTNSIFGSIRGTLDRNYARIPCRTIVSAIADGYCAMLQDLNHAVFGSFSKYEGTQYRLLDYIL